MSETEASRASDTFLSPTLSGTRKVAHVTTSTSSAEVAIVGHLTTPPVGGGRAYITFQSGTSTAYIAFKNGHGSTSITANNGFPIPPGVVASFWISLNELDYMEYIAGGAGDLWWYISSPVTNTTGT